MVTIIDRMKGLELKRKNTLIFLENADFIREALKQGLSKRQIHAYLRGQNILDTCYSNFARLCNRYLDALAATKTAEKTIRSVPLPQERNTTPVFEYRPDLANMPGYDK